MSRYVDIDQIIADIFDKWGCDPAYYVGVSGADAHEAKLDADLIEFLRSKPYVEIVRCGECEWWTKQRDSIQGRCELLRMNPTGGWYCADGKREDNPNE